MKYNSTRNNNLHIESADAITMGISREGGLFIPEKFPEISRESMEDLIGKSYNEVAKYILSLYLTDFTEEEIAVCVDNAYNAQNFEDNNMAPLAKLSDSTYLLELWHGPTCAFKDLALQILPYLLTVSARKTIGGKKAVILVATSGDTGKAALEGFRDVENTEIIVFYPSDGVSPMQKLQMTTQEGSNVHVCAINGNFDDAQSGVKAIFTNHKLEQSLAEKNMVFSSANSINFGRLLPQIVYYIHAYLELVSNSHIEYGNPVNIAVPTGNFGNILAAYYANQMGIPVNKFICASNANNILTDFINTGKYDKNRSFFTTISPSMDILISSNLERLLYEISGKDDRFVRNMMGDLRDKSCYEIPANIHEKLKHSFFGGFCTDDATKQTIRQIFDDYSYLCDTHTAVAVNVHQQYIEQTGDKTPTIIASTASPFKFAKSVCDSFGKIAENPSEFELTEKLAELSGITPPDQLIKLKDKPVRFGDSCEKNEMESYVRKILNIN